MSVRPSSRRRPGRPPSINLLAMELEEAAECIKLRLLSYGRAAMAVYVADNGDVLFEWLQKPRRQQLPPEHWLLGNYRPSVPIMDLEDDLVVRLREIRAAQRGAA